MNQRFLKPPWVAAWLARLCLHEVDADVVLGDLEETYGALHQRYSRRAARCWYWSQVLRSCPNLIYRTFFWSFVMLKNYAKIALRNLRKHKGYACINVSGLILGIVCCLLIVLYVQDELGFDRFHENAGRIYRVTAVRGLPGELHASANTAMPIGPALKTDFPEVLDAVRARRMFDPVMRHQDTQFTERRVFAVDSTFLEVFSFPLVLGDPETALDRPDAVILTQTTARRYFGETNPVGQTLTYQNSGNQMALTVTGVARDVPDQSHLRFDFLVTLRQFRRSFFDDWRVFVGNYTYLLLPDAYDTHQLAAKLPDFVERHVGPLDPGYEYSLHIQPLTDIHLYSHLATEAEPNGDITYVYLFSAIAFFILLIACINFVNLTTARSVRRAREVGLRKVIGAQRTQLVGQFLGESMLLGLLALAAALVVLEVVLPVFNTFSGKTLTLSYLDNGLLLLALGGIMLFIGLAAGAYPAFILSAFQPAVVLKGSLTRGRSGARARQGLVVFQFAVSIVLIICTGVVLDQMQYVQTKDLGFDKEQVAVLPIDRAIGQQSETIKTALLQHPNVVAATASMLVPSTSLWTYGVRVENSDEGLTMGTYKVDHDFLDTYAMEVIAGRWFSNDLQTDADEVMLINEAAAKRLGFATPEAALGTRLVWARRRTLTVVGVVKDFHVVSFRKAIEPTLFMLDPEYYYLSVRLHADDLAATLAHLETTMATFAPQRPFEFFFVDERFDALHRADQQLGLIFGAFSLLATLIACLGLFGLTAFTAEQRTKEVGIRKVLGASAASIVLLLSRDFTRLVVAALVVAAPLAYLAMNRWLDAFTYRVPLSGWIFLLAGGLALLIAFATVSYQATKAARVNPVESLRYE